MKRFHHNMFPTAMFALVLACISAPVASADQEENTAESTAALVAKGAGYWSKQCNRCHNLRDPAEFTDDIWDVSVNHMRIRANIPADQISAIKAFLKSSN